MKKIIATSMLTLLMLTLAACGNKNGETTTEATTPASTEESTEETTTAPAETVTEAVNEGEAGENNELTEIRDAVAAAYGENYIPNMPLDEEILEAMYGITPDMYEAVLAETSAISVHVDTFIAVKADSDRVEDVKTAFENYRTFQLEEGMHYPMNLPKIEASEVLVYGDYVFYVMLGMADQDIEGEAELLAAFQEQNQIAKSVLDAYFAQ